MITIVCLARSLISPCHGVDVVWFLEFSVQLAVSCTAAGIILFLAILMEQGRALPPSHSQALSEFEGV